MGLMDGVSKVSFNFLYTLWVYRSCIYTLTVQIKVTTNNDDVLIDGPFLEGGGTKK